MRYFYEEPTCPPPPPLTPAQANTNANAILKAMGVQACQTSTTQTEGGSGGLSIGPLDIIKYNNASTSSATVGCEKVTAMTESYNKSVNNVLCVLKSSKNIQTTSQAGINSIEMEATNGDIIIDCADKRGSGLEFNQSVNLKLIQNINLSEEEYNNLATTMDDTIKDASELLLDSKQGWGATPEGQRIIKEKVNNITKNNIKSQIKQAVTEINTSQLGSNTVKLKAGRNLYIYGNQCKINQDIVLEMVATNIVNSVLTANFEDLTKIINENDSKISAKSESGGAPPPPTTTSWIRDVMAVVVLIVILVIGIWAYKKYKTKGMDEIPMGGMPMGTTVFMGRPMSIRFSQYSDDLTRAISRGSYGGLMAILVYIGIIGYALYLMNQKQLHSEEFRHRQEKGEDLLASSTQGGFW